MRLKSTRLRALAPNTLRTLLVVLIGGLGTVSVGAAEGNLVDLVNRKVLRVCSSPSNLPYSNEKHEGYENKIAEIVADELKIPIEYTFMPQGLGFVRLTLAAKRCDLIIGTAQSDEFTLNTNHYYRTTYAMAYRKGQGLDGVDSLMDPRLKDKRVGIQAGAPPGDQVAKAGLMANAKPYPLMYDPRYHNIAQDMINDVRSGEIDVAILWGPHAGYYAKRGGEELEVVPLLKAVPGTSRLEYRITMGVRMGETAWKHRINEIIAKRQGDIDAVLLEYGVPLIDEDNKLITAARRTAGSSH